MYRRHFIHLLVVGLGAATVPLYNRLSAWLPVAAIDHEQSSNLRHLIDRLIPADSSPSGSMLGVDSAILQRAAQDKNYRRLLLRGLDWISRQAEQDYQRAFYQLAPSQQDSLLALAEQSSVDSDPRQFFERLRWDSFSHYYAQTDSWSGLCSAGAPQPRGHPDMASPPSCPRAL